ncbi:MAG: rubredoxin [Aquabacterium sp.]|nr:MAG: rubredoxin [Aquabacterium sp.]
MNTATANAQLWQCDSCAFVYDPSEGWPSEGIAPGTAWEDVPHDWRCPDCSSSKSDFSPLAG